jgi:hypothetical protein
LIARTIFGTIIMNKKAGRPPLPKGESKAAQIAARFKPVLDKQVAKAAQETGATKAEVVREATIQDIQRPPIWMQPTKWKRDELDGQLIRFDLKSPTRELAGVGKLAVRQNPLGQIAVDIFVDECMVPGRGFLTRIWLAENKVKKIELNREQDADKIKFTLIG